MTLDTRIASYNIAVRALQRSFFGQVIHRGIEHGGWKVGRATTISDRISRKCMTKQAMSEGMGREKTRLAPRLLSRPRDIPYLRIQGVFDRYARCGVARKAGDREVEAVELVLPG